MNTTRDDMESSPPRRVAVMLGPDGAAHAALQAAAELARMLNVDLAGWFVEDARLLEVAQFPFAVEADWTSATLRPLQAASLERALRLAAQSAELQWREAMRAFDVAASFRTVRESPQRQLMQLTREFGVVVLCPQRTRPAGEVRPAPQAPARPLVAVIGAQIESHVESHRDLELAARWAAQRRRPLHLVWFGRAAAAFVGADAMTERLRELDIDAAAHWIASSTEAVEDVLRRAQPEGVVLSTAHPLAQPDHLCSLAARLRCPVVLVR